jgi:hypothetical protein
MYVCIACLHVCESMHMRACMHEHMDAAELLSFYPHSHAVRLNKLMHSHVSSLHDSSSYREESGYCLRYMTLRISLLAIHTKNDSHMRTWEKQQVEK